MAQPKSATWPTALPPRTTTWAATQLPSSGRSPRCARTFSFLKPEPPERLPVRTALPRLSRFASRCRCQGSPVGKPTGSVEMRFEAGWNDWRVSSGQNLTGWLS